MNCVDFAIKQVVLGGDISPDVLRLAFDNANKNYNGNMMHTTNDYTVIQGIREKIIYGIVLPACNAGGGVLEVFDLYGSRFELTPNGQLSVNVPDSVLGGREIVSCVEAYPGSYNMVNGLDAGTSSMLKPVSQDQCGVGQVNKVMGAAINSLNPSAGDVLTFNSFTYTGTNSFIINDCNTPILNLTLKAYVGYDSNLSKINPRAFMVFTELVELAVKAHIYKTCRRGIESAVMAYGIPIDAIKDEVHEYADAWKSYTELLNGKWLTMMVRSDNKHMTDLNRLTTPGVLI